MLFHRWFIGLVYKVIVAAALLAALIACGDPNSTLPPIVVTFSNEFPPPAALEASATAGIAAIVTNGPPNAEVNFTCLPAGECGTFSPNPIASNVPTTYQAPPVVPPDGTVTVTATSVNDTTKSVSASISIN
jgi:hypothetical protein